MAVFTQGNRLLSVNTPLGPDVLLLAGFAGKEEMSRLFRYELDLLSEKVAISPKDIVGKPITWTVSTQDKEPRHFNGIVCRFAAGALHKQGLRTYRAEVVPWLWFLTLTSNCRIFQDKTTPQIIELLFEEYGFNDFEPALRRSYIPWEYCVQYRESAFNFISRLLEHEGIFCYYRHEDGKHTLVLGDHKGAYMDCVEKQVSYSAGSLAANHVDAWEHQCEFRPGRWAHTDYNFETPSTRLLTSTNTLVDLPGVNKFEVFDYPGDYRVKGEGEADVRIRMEEEEVGHDIVAGAGTCCTFTPGGGFTLENHEIASEAGKRYVLTSVQHTATETSYSNAEEPSTYRNTFACIPDAVTFRPSRTTPQPVVHGPQTAVVVGPAGEKIYCDKYGRVKVQFHWDRLGQKDEKSSCWVRVSQNWGGARWGGMFIPHVGQEVIVEFEEGDPDRPLITGRVYNAEAMPPLELPANKSQNIIRDHGSNEIKMQGEDGKQSIRMFSPYANTVFKIGAENEPFKGFFFKTDQEWNEFVTANKQQIVDGKKTEVIAKDSHSHTEGNVDASIHGNSNYYLRGNYICRVDGTQEYSTRGHYITKVIGANWVMIVGADTDVYLSAQQQLNHGTRIAINFSKELFKTPDHGSHVGRVKEAWGTLKKDVGDIKTKAGETYDKVAGAFKSVYGTVSTKTSKWKASLGDVAADGKKADLKFGGKFKTTASEVIHNAVTTVKKKFKSPNLKDKG